MSWLAATIASVGVLVFILAAPFPRWSRYLFPFSFFIFYQYAVIARSYVLIPLLLFAIAAVYRHDRKHVAVLTALTALLANVSLHGFLFAGVLTGSFLLLTIHDWSSLPVGTRVHRACAIGLMALLALALVLQLRRAADLVGFGTLNLGVQHLVAVSALKLRDAFTGSFILSGVVLAASIWWFYRRGTLLLFLGGAAALLALEAIAYSNVWHEGLLVLWWGFNMWISWPKTPTRIPVYVNACWAVFLAIQLFWSAHAAGFDLRFPYSGSRALAEYIQQHNLYHQRIFAFGAKSAAILPYFRENIFANWPRDHSFWFWSNQNTIDSKFPEIARLRPAYVILAVSHDSDAGTVRQRKMLGDDKYQLLQRFDGALCWKSVILEGNFYELYYAASTVSSPPES